MESNCFGIIYKAENLTNGKVYIGQTSYTLDKRKREHFMCANSESKKRVVFYQAIRKYGEESFNWEVIDYAQSEEELNEKEIHWINHYKSYVGFDDSKGYNMTLGGEGRVGYSHHEETKVKISESHKNRSRDTFFTKEVLQFSLDGKLVATHDSAVSGAETVGCHLQNITDCCRGDNQKTVYGYIWIYKEDYTDELLKNRINDLPKQSNKAKEVLQFDLNGNLIARYDSIYNASKANGFDRSSIAKCCKGKMSKHKNFIWKYAD